MSKSYVKPCIYCKEEIEMSDRDGKWLPYNKTGTPHECRKKPETVYIEPSRTDGTKKIATIDGIAALDLIPYINHADYPLYFTVEEYKGAKIVEVYTDE